MSSSSTVDLTIEGRWVAEIVGDMRKQLPFAAATAINRTADEAIAEVKRQLPALGFTIRDPRFRDFMFRQVQRATKDSPVAKVAIAGPKASVWTRHIEGGVVTTSDILFKPLFAPTSVLRPDKSAVIPRAYYPSALRLVERRTPSGVLPPKGRVNRHGRPQLQGKRRTFVIDARSAGLGRTIGVFERTGPGRRDIRELWSYMDRKTIRPRLPFDAIVSRMVADRFQINFDGFLDYALRTAK